MKYVVLDSIRNSDQDTLTEQFALDVLMGFSTREKFLPSKYFYDKKGSDLFAKITDTSEYYPTQCEFEVLKKHKTHLKQLLKNEPLNIVELGAGDGRKTKVLLKEFHEGNMDVSYHPVDISEAAMKELTESLEKEFPGINQMGLVAEYLESIDWINKNNQSGRKNLVLFLGSNIGNFHKTDAMVFLRTLWKGLNKGDYLYVGFDLKKDIDVLLNAYNDSHGYTKEFNLNLLQRINDKLGGHFDLKSFQHFGTYNPHLGAMESYLISLKEQTVKIDALEKSFHFKAFEPVHLEYSYKYLMEDVEYFAKEAGFKILENYTDSKNYYLNSLWEVEKSSL